MLEALSFAGETPLAAELREAQSACGEGELPRWRVQEFRTWV